MDAKWGWLTPLGIVVILFLAGCKSTQPDLKPAKQPEVFNPPPENVSPNYPKQAFNTDDATRRPSLDPGGFVPTRGNGSTPGSFGGPTQR